MAPMGVSPAIGLTNHGGVEPLGLLCVECYSFAMFKGTEVVHARIVEHGRDLCAAAKVLPARTTCSRYGPCALAARLRGPKIHTMDGQNGSEDAEKACTAWLTHLLRPSTIRGLQSSIHPEGARRGSSRFVVSGEHSKAAPTTPLARPKTSVTMPVSGCRRLKLASGSLITRPTCRTELGYHRDHL